MKPASPTSVADLLARLENITAWFNDQETVDIEAALVKVREGAELIQTLTERLAKTENEFTEIKKKLSLDAENN